MCCGNCIRGRNERAAAAPGASASRRTLSAVRGAYATLDAGRVGQIYTEDALLLPPGGEILRGRGAIREHYKEGFDADRERGHTRRISFELVDRVVSGDVRNDYGYYTIIGRGPDGHEEQWRGKFAKVWTRGRDGEWRIRSDSYSSAPKR
jgi:uncharacterized protein (TIGR02246 family)